MIAPVDLVRERLEGAGCDPRSEGRGWKSRCPVHVDTDPSLGLAEGDDGRALVRCRAGCQTDDVLRVLGLDVRQLFAGPSNGHRSRPADSRPAATPSSEDLAELERYVDEASRRLAGTTDVARLGLDYVGRRFGLERDHALKLGIGVDPGSSVVDRPAALATFAGPPRLVIPLRDAAGAVRACQGRDLTGRARARWTSPKGEGWARWGAFHLHREDPVLLVEGPSDALAAAGAGFAAVAIRGASLDADPALVEALKGRQVLVAGDADEAGARFRTRIVNTLNADGGQAGWFEVPKQYGDLAAWREQTGPDFAADLAALEVHGCSVHAEAPSEPVEQKPEPDSEPDGEPSAPDRSTWSPVDLRPLASGGELHPPPSCFRRSDGVALIYAGKVNGFVGESEAGKSWGALVAAAEQVSEGQNVTYIDFEDDAGTVTGRLVDLGVPWPALIELFRYIRPDEPLVDQAGRALPVANELWSALEEDQPSLVVLDGVTEAMVLHGWNPLDNADAARFVSTIARPCTKHGAAALMVDHVTKDREHRGAYAIGAQHKRAAITGASLIFEVIRPFGRGRSGAAKLTLAKDKPGHVRRHEVNKRVAELRIDSTEEGTVRAELVAPTGTGPDGEFRPTVLMERVSVAVEAQPGLTTNGIKKTVPGKTEAKEAAIRVLVSEGYMEVSRDGQALRHEVVRPYREAAEEGLREGGGAV